MAQEHENVLTLALIKATEYGFRLFKNKVGSAWVGKLVNSYPDSKAGRCVELIGASFQPFGLLVASSGFKRNSKGDLVKKNNGGGFDLIGWQSVKITPDMVGTRLAVFTAIDAKTEGYSTLDSDQRNFAREVIKAGGSAIIARRTKDRESVDFVQLTSGDFKS